jgi:hypothetical protein
MVTPWNFAKPAPEVVDFVYGPAGERAENNKRLFFIVDIARR